MIRSDLKFITAQGKSAQNKKHTLIIYYFMVDKQFWTTTVTVRSDVISPVINNRMDLANTWMLTSSSACLPFVNYFSPCQSDSLFLLFLKQN